MKLKSMCIALAAGVLLPLHSLAQEYNRSGVSIISVSYGDAYDQLVSSYFDNYELSDRYDANSIGTTTLLVNENREQFKTSDDGKKMYITPDRKDQIGSALDAVGKELVSFLFQRNDQGVMNTELLQSRGLYNATDENFMEASATKLGLAAIKDSGMKLMENNYVMVYDVVNLRYEYRKDLGDSKGEYYWICTPVVYLYKLQWSEELFEQMIGCWITDQDDTETRESKKAAFAAMHFPMKYVMQVSDSQMTRSSGVEANRRKNPDKPNTQLKTDTYIGLMNSATEDFMEKIEGGNAAFQLQNAVFATHPLRVKMGKKEGVKANNRFFVYENVSNDGKNIKEVRKGVVLASHKISDNRKEADGKTPTSVFYQIAGRKIDAGMTVKEKKSLGVALELGYRAGEMEGVNIGFVYSHVAGRVTNHTGLMNVVVDKDAWNMALGYGYGLRINNFEIYPYIGGGMDRFLKDDKDDKEKEPADKDEEESRKEGWFGMGGLRFNLNICYPVQLFGGCEYDYLLSEGEDYKTKCLDKNRNINGWNAYGGVRICF